MAELNDHIVPLDELDDFGVAEGDPDVRGWEVFSSDGQRIGSVEQLLVDTAAMKVRYLDVDLADDLFVLSDDRHVLVPLENVELRERGNDVWVQGLGARDVAGLPAYTGGGVDPRMEESVHGAFRGRSDDAAAVEER